MSKREALKRGEVKPSKEFEEKLELKAESYARCARETNEDQSECFKAGAEFGYSEAVKELSSCEEETPYHHPSSIYEWYTEGKRHPDGGKAFVAWPDHVRALQASNAKLMLAEDKISELEKQLAAAEAENAELKRKLEEVEQSLQAMSDLVSDWRDQYLKQREEAQKMVIAIKILDESNTQFIRAIRAVKKDQYFSALTTIARNSINEIIKKQGMHTCAELEKIKKETAKIGEGNE